MREYKYILDAKGRPKLESDLFRWATFMETALSRSVSFTKVGRYHVSTVFLGIDYNMRGVGKPILWETMVFTNRKYSTKYGHYRKSLDEFSMRHTSKTAALEYHKKIVNKVKKLK